MQYCLLLHYAARIPSPIRHMLQIESCYGLGGVGGRQGGGHVDLRSLVELTGMLLSDEMKGGGGRGGGSKERTCPQELQLLLALRVGGKARHVFSGHGARHVCKSQKEGGGVGGGGVLNDELWGHPRSGLLPQNLQHTSKTKAHLQS